MTFLAAFSFWGALQGFGPPIAIALRGPDLSTTPYRGDQPGSYEPRFWYFAVPWALIFLLGFAIWRSFARRAERATRA
jgi:hypothetical protein